MEAPSLPRPPPTSYGSTTKPKQSKSRSGCQTCKLKRLKCDETKPGCLQCQKRNVECAGYQKDYKWRTFEETKAKSKTAAQRKSPESDRPSVTQHPTSNTNNVSNEDVARAGPQKQRRDNPIDYNLPLAWPSNLHTDSTIRNSYVSGQHHGRNLSASPEQQNNTSTHPTLLPTEGNPSDIGFHDGNNDEPYMFVASATGSSPAEDNSARSLSSQSPELYFSSVRRMEQQAGLPEERGISSSLPTQPLPFQFKATRFTDSDAVANSSKAMAPSEHHITTSYLDHATAWHTPRTFSPLSSNVSGHTSDSEDVIGDVGLSSPEELMLRFDQQTCSILSVIDGPNENPWRSLIRPMIVDSPPLYHAILSMAAFHGTHDSAALHTPGMAHMTKSIRWLASRVQDMPLDYALATSLALSFSEGWDSHVSTGVQHLRASSVMVKNLLIKYRQDKQLGQLTADDANRIQYLCNTFVYMDVIARLTSFQEAPEIDYGEIMNTVNDFSNGQDEVDPLMGCAMTLFPLIGRLAHLVSRVYKTESNSLTLVSTAMELKEEIEKWQAPSAMAFERPEDPNTEVQHLLQTAEAYRYAALLYLHQAVPEIPSESAERLAKKVLFKLASVPLSSGAILVQIFPLFAASCEVTDPDDRSWVVQRWNAMTRRLKIGNIKSCWGVVQELWSRRDVAETEKANRVLRRNRARGLPEDGAASNAVEIPLSLKRKVSSIDEANERNIVYQGNNNNNNKNQHRRGGGGSRGNLSRSWSSGSGELPTNSWQMKQPRTIDSSGDGLSTSLTSNRMRRPLNDTFSTTQLEHEFTIRGSLHWLGVMSDWTWEVFL